ncbi:hypothetical protein K8R66_01540 [bacterium]|nr:hypothetical protein [bacterium]
MIIYKRILGFLVAFLIPIFLLLIYYRPRFFYYFLGAILVTLIFYFWRIKNRFVETKEIIFYFFIFLFYFINVCLFFILVDNFYIKLFLLFYLLISNVFIFDAIFKRIYENKAIVNQIFIYIDLLSAWFLIFSLFYLIIFLRFSLFWSVFILFLGSFLLVAIRFYWLKIKFKENLFYLFLVSVILSEIYLFTTFLPFNLYFATFIVWIWYYLLIDFLVDKIKERFIWRKKWKIVLILVFIFIFSLISVKY